MVAHPRINNTIKLACNVFYVLCNTGLTTYCLVPYTIYFNCEPRPLACRLVVQCLPRITTGRYSACVIDRIAQWIGKIHWCVLIGSIPVTICFCSFTTKRYIGTGRTFPLVQDSLLAMYKNYARSHYHHALQVWLVARRIVFVMSCP